MNNFAYVTMLYPNKHGECTYLDGAILTALGLRKQNIKYKIICMITKDIKQDVIDVLNLLYDEIVIVDYISPIKSLNGIDIISDIFSPKDYKNQEEYSEMAKIFTKLHIFNSDIFSYDKLLFIDNDLIPINKYDELFNLECPAAWLEQILEEKLVNNIQNNLLNNRYTRICDIWKEIQHGDKIPNIYTQIYKIPGRSINAGLMLIKPDINKFNEMIKILQTPKSKWKDVKFKFKGTINIDRQHVKYYILPEQEFLTQYFENDWYLIDSRYCYWGNTFKYDIFGMHMAGLNYRINGETKHSKTWQIQIPIDDGFNVISNKTALWGIKKFPELINILYKNLKFYVDNRLYDIKDIIIDDEIYDKLNRYQKRIIQNINIKVNNNRIANIYDHLDCNIDIDINLKDSDVPKIIHLCYKTKNIPDYIIPNWKKLNPDYDIILYDNDDCRKFLLDNFEQKAVDIFNYIKDGPIKADFFRVCVLYKVGGVYSDIDCKLLVPIDNFLEKDVTFLTCTSANNINEINSQFIICPKEHFILKACIDKYYEIYDNKINYSYWGWSIVFIMARIIAKIFKKYINDEGIFYDNHNNKYQFIKEYYPNNFIYSSDVYCSYKNIKILNNRYNSYDSINHIFK
jgi:mannosyltransferase OCH1-like enzyme